MNYTPFKHLTVLVVVATFVCPVTLGLPGHAATTSPSSVLRTGTDHQRGLIQHSDWSYYTKDGGCVTLSGDGEKGFPEEVAQHTLGDKARFRFLVRTKPFAVNATGWRTTDADGQPAGPGEAIEVTLKRHRNDAGKVVAWDAVFEPTAAGPLYLRVRGNWKHECGQRDAVWTYRMETTA